MEKIRLQMINPTIDMTPIIQLTRKGYVVNENGEPVEATCSFLHTKHPYFKMDPKDGGIILQTPALLGTQASYAFLLNLHHLLLLELPHHRYFWQPLTLQQGEEGILSYHYSYAKPLHHLMKGSLEEHGFYQQMTQRARYYRWFLTALFRSTIEIAQGEGPSLTIKQLQANPFDPCGISQGDLRFLHLFMIYLLTQEIDESWGEEGEQNQERVSKRLDYNTPLKRQGHTISQREWTLAIFNEMEQLNKKLSLQGENEFLLIKQRALSYPFKWAYSMRKRKQQMGGVEAPLSLAREYKQQANDGRFRLLGYEDLELSTQILMKEAIKQGICVDVLDASENFISLGQGERMEYVKQATKTSKDNYVSVLMMENKLVTKKILEQGAIRVPKGSEFHHLQDAYQSIGTFSGHPLVIKPKSTNFGLGISIFQTGATEEALKKALQLAFSHDQTVLVEEFIPGKEYRFLVIDDQVVGVLHRVPANVIGDGIHTIAELVAKKNENPLRGQGYKTPLEKIKLDEQVELFLSQSHRTVQDIPAEGETVYLRKNSNISTGGDSIDFTDVMPQRFKEIAVAAAQVVGAKICGVDMMIEREGDEESPYAIIELNFNPAIHIHSYPSIGVERNIAQHILKLLEFTS